MTDLQRALDCLKDSLCPEVALGGLFARNSIAHKWKAPWRSLILREVVSWRLYDLLEQSRILVASNGLLGARILLRSAFETLAVLIYINKAMREVVSGSLDFHDFSDRTQRLMLGSKDKSTPWESINVISLLKAAEKRYQGLEGWYIALCESAHPNCEGMLLGYSVADAESRVTSFESRWASLYGENHESTLAMCLTVFEAEYNEEWPAAFEALEKWISANDEQLEASKPGGHPTDPEPH